MLVIFGLGNPGSKYEGTRHNAGVETLRRLAASCHKKLTRRCFSSYQSCVVTTEAGRSARLVFPLTYMNSSGEVVPKVVGEGDTVLVICDQMDLPCGRMRLRTKGSSAGHNGLKSMMAHLPEGFWRLYIGVGRPDEGVSVIDHVLTRFSPEDRRLVELCEEEAARQILRIIDGVESFQVVEQAINSYRAE